MKFSDLFRDPKGTLSHTRLWNNIASLIFTVIIIRRELLNTLTDDLLIWYSGMFIAGALISKGVSLTEWKSTSSS